MKKILIIEDNQINMEVAADMLGKAGYKVLKAYDAMSGIKQANHEKPDLILMDVRLPQINGLEAAHILKEEEKTQDIKIVALTACAMPGDKETILKHCDGYIAKPIHFKSFLEAVESYLSPH
jgi:two-component system cell cycle response regulator DivK